MGTIARCIGLSRVFAIVGLCSLWPVPAIGFCAYFNYELHPNQVVPPAQAQGFGASELHFCDDDSLRGYVHVDVPAVTAVHIHGPAERGENGDLLYELPMPVRQTVSVLLGPLPPEHIGWLGADEMYVDVHTASYPDGAIRGQIHAEIAVTETPWGVVKRLYR